MAYDPLTWVNGTTPINANNLNHIESGINTNSEAIGELQGSLQFKGVISTLPTSDNVTIGDVYQASASNLVSSNKIGDLLIYIDDDTWHVVPSGDENNGTVTSVTQGNGISISGGAITSSGTISIDEDYIKRYLLTQEPFTKLNQLNAIATDNNMVDGWPTIDPRTIVTSVNRPITNATGSSTAKVMSQSGITSKLNEKANLMHEHSISDVTDLGSYLATSGSSGYVKAAANNHIHGRITNDGHLLKPNGTDTAPSGQIVVVGSGGIIESTNSIDSGLIDASRGLKVGTNDTIYLTTLRSEIQANSDVLTECKAANKQAAKKDHTHDIFNTTRNGYVPQASSSNNHTFLASNQQWIDLDNKYLAKNAEKNEFIEFTTSTPAADGAAGKLKIAVLTTDPGTKYDNWLYLILATER